MLPAAALGSHRSSLGRRLLAVSEWGTILVEDDGTNLLVAVADRPFPTAVVDADPDSLRGEEFEEE